MKTLKPVESVVEKLRKEVNDMPIPNQMEFDQMTGNQKQIVWDVVMVVRHKYEKALTQDRLESHKAVVEVLEGDGKKFAPAGLVQVGGLESNEWKFVPKEDGMYCLNCERFTPEEGCICGMISRTDAIQKMDELFGVSK